MASGVPCIVSKNCGCYFDYKSKNRVGVRFRKHKRIVKFNEKVEDLNHAELIELKEISKKINNYSLEKYLNGIENAIHKALDKKSFQLFISYCSFSN